MSRVTCDLTISLDGYLAGPNQTPTDPLGVGGELLHRWQSEDAESNAAELEGILAAGAYIMGRNMFAGPGTWDEQWRGWWGEDPPYHAPVFVLTHHPREPLVMAAAPHCADGPGGERATVRWRRGPQARAH